MAFLAHQQLCPPGLILCCFEAHGLFNEEFKMTISRLANLGSRTRRAPAQVHRFAVGELVQMGTGLGQVRTYRVTATLPERGDSPQYRIRNDEERHERVVTQDLLEPASQPRNAALIERTFGNG
jgi:hypothetical protein